MKTRAVGLLPLLFACVVKLDAPVPSSVSCSRDEHCPGSAVCVRDLGRCAEANGACFEQLDGAFHSVGDGRRCALEQGVAGVCVRGACEPSVCGDGILDLQGGAEQCEDGNENPNDGCAQCRQTAWVARVLVGASEGGGVADAVSLSFPAGVAVDGRDNLYVADADRNRVLKVDAASGRISVVAGTGREGREGDGGPATLAQLDGPSSVAVDGLGDLYISDSNNWCVRRVDALTGRISTVAGIPGQISQAPEGGLAAATPIPLPGAVAVDGRGHLYFADRYGNRVFRIDASTGRIERYAGTREMGTTGDGGPATEAKIHEASALAVDRSGNLFVGSYGTVRKVSAADRTIQTVARFDDAAANGIAVAADGSLAVSLANHAVVLFDAAGAPAPLAGTGEQGFGGDGGPATAAQLDFPVGLAWSKSGALLIADSYNHRIRRVEGSVISTVVGSGSREPGGCAKADCLEEFDAWGTAVDASGRLLVVQRDKNVVRRVDLAAKTTEIVAGVYGVGGSAGDGGPAREAQLNYPEDVAVDAQGNLLIVDGFNGSLRRVDAVSGQISNVPATQGKISSPSSVAVGADGSLLVTDTGHQKIVLVDGATGQLSVVAGTGATGDSGDGGSALAATFTTPTDAVFDLYGRVVILDKNAHRVRRIDSGVIHTIAGNGSFGYSGDGGAPQAAQLNNPVAIAYGPNGALYVADFANDCIRRVDPSGTRIETYAGGPSATTWADGVPVSTAKIAHPQALSFDATGALFVSEGDIWDDQARVTRGNRLRRVDPETGIITTVVGGVAPAGDGPVATSRLGAPAALVSVSLPDGSTPLWIADGASGRVRSVDLQAGSVSTVVGYPEGLAGEGAQASFSRLLGEPLGIAADAVAGAVYVSEAAGHTVRRVDLFSATPTISTLIGEFERVGYDENHLEGPRGLLLSPDRAVLFVADAGNHAVRAIDLASRATSIVAGTPGLRGDVGDGGPASEALLHSPGALAWGSDGSLYVADTGNHRVRRILAPLDPASTIETVTGNGSAGTFGEGSPASLFPLDSPEGIAVDRFGNLFVAGAATLRLVSAGDDQVATGEDAVSIVYGRAPRLAQPESDTICLTGLAFADGSAGPDSRIYLLDGCLGYLMALERERL